MTPPIRDQYLEAAKLANIDLVELPTAEAEELRSRVAAQFAQGQVSWLWARFADSIGIQDDGAWKWIDDFLAGREAVIFFNEFDDRTIFLLPAGASFVAIQRETYGSEFYLTDSEGSYVLCYNHHRFLVAVGTARDWLRERIAQARAPQ